MTPNQYYLAHHGILGQKWGVRRFQNVDGSLTAAGKQRYYDFKDKSDSKDERKDAVKATIAAYALTPVGVLANVGLAVGAGVISPKLLAMPVLTLGAGIAGTVHIIKKDKQAKEANEKENKFKEEREKNPIDKKTGFHKKTKQMTAEEDMERVNPGYNNWDRNTKNNCVLCTMSMELRRRGYDVQARKATDGYDANTAVKDWFKNASPKRVDGSLSDHDLIVNAVNGLKQSNAEKNKND